MIMPASVFERGLIGVKMLNEFDIHDVNLTESVGSPPTTSLDVHCDLTDPVNTARPSFFQPVWVEPLHEDVGIACGPNLLDLLLGDLVRIPSGKLLTTSTRSKDAYRQGKQSESQEDPWVLTIPFHGVGESQ